MSELVKGCLNCRHRNPCPESKLNGIGDCEKYNYRWQPDCIALESQLSTITAERDRMREAFLDYHLIWCGSSECGECLIDDCALRELGILVYGYETDFNSTPSEAEVYKKAVDIAAKILSGLGCSPLMRQTCRNDGRCEECRRKFILNEARRKLSRKEG